MKDKIVILLRPFLTRQFVIFLFFSGVAAAVNIGTRIPLNVFMPYGYSIVVAYCFGMVTAFTLNKYLNFKGSENKVHFEAINFIAINLLGLLITFSVSIALAYYLLPFIGIFRYRFLVAHIIGTAAPAFTSFLGHKYITFGKYSLVGISKSILARVTK
jgi:putative flippase GtrA